MTNNISTIINATVASVAATTIFDRLPGEAYDAACDRLVKAHMVKVTNNAGEAKIVDLVDIRLTAGEDYHTIETEGLIIEGVDGIIDDMKSMYWILNGLHRAGNSWNEIKESLFDEEDAWI